VLTDRGQRVVAALRTERRRGQDAAHGADPSLARKRTGYCQAVGYQDAGQLEPQAVHRWNRDAALVRERSRRQPGQRVRSVPVTAERLDAELASAAAAPELGVGSQALLVQPALLVPLALPALVPRRPPRPEPALLLPARRSRSFQRPLSSRRLPFSLLPLSSLSSSWPAAVRSPASP
jgi:hypothetical protein